MPSEHIKLRRELQEKEKSEFLALLDRVMISEEEKKVMIEYYCNKKPLCCIALDMGYSDVGVAKMHNRVLLKIGKIIAKENS